MSGFVADPCLNFVFRKSGGAVGAVATQIDYFLGRGETGALSETRAVLGHPFTASKVRRETFLHVGMELSQENDFPIKLTQEKFIKGSKPIATSPGLRAARQRPIPSEEIKLRQGCDCRLLSVAKISARVRHALLRASTPCSGVTFLALTT